MSIDYEEFATAFESCTIDASSFSHADHVGVAYALLHRYEFLDAAARYGQCIHTIASAAGVPGKFNATITLAFLSVIAERIGTTKHSSYEEFLDQNADLLDSAVLERWYSSARLKSPLARTMFLLPDAA